MNPNTFNAWHIVALGTGAFVVHAYHLIVNVGGLKRIWSNFWNGPIPVDNRFSPSPVSPTVADRPRSISIPLAQTPSDSKVA